MAIILRVYGQGAIVIFGVLHPRAIWPGIYGWDFPTKAPKASVEIPNNSVNST